MRRSYLLAVVVLFAVGCSSNDDSASGSPTGDECLGAHTKSTNCKDVYSDRLVLSIESLTGDVPPGLAPGSTSCSTAPSATTSVFSDITGSFPSDCDSAWKLALRINEGERSGALQPSGSLGASTLPAATIAISLATELDGCNVGARSYPATGQGAVQLTVLESDAPSCARLELDDLELASAQFGSFRLTGELRAKFLPVGAP